MRTDPAPDWLSEPAIECFKDARGRVESAYITLRREKAVRAIQPNRDHLVFFYLGADDLPVGLRLLEPVVGAAGTEILMRLVAGVDGAPVGVDREVRHVFIPIEQLDATLHRIRDANEQLVAGANS